MVYSYAEKIRMKSLETVGVVRDDALTVQVGNADGLLSFMPPLAKGLTATRRIQGDQENAVQFRF